MYGIMLHNKGEYPEHVVQYSTQKNLYIFLCLEDLFLDIEDLFCVEYI